jgi:hypothetical protein
LSVTAEEARSLLSELAGRGISLRPGPDGTLRCKPKGKLTPRDTTRIKECKRSLLGLLASTDKSHVAYPAYLAYPPPTKADTYGEPTGDASGDATGDASVPTFVREREEQAARLGLVARWSSKFGYIAIHDPTTGEWYDLPTKEAPDWAKRECFKRRELRKYQGITRLLTQAEMEEVWREEETSIWASPWRPDDARDGLIYDTDNIEEE